MAAVKCLFTSHQQTSLHVQQTQQRQQNRAFSRIRVSVLGKHERSVPRRHPPSAVFRPSFECILVGCRTYCHVTGSGQSNDNVDKNSRALACRPRSVVFGVQPYPAQPLDMNGARNMQCLRALETDIRSDCSRARQYPIVGC